MGFIGNEHSEEFKIYKLFVYNDGEWQINNIII